MRKFFTGLARFIAFIVVLILIIAIPLSLLAYDVGRVVFDPPLVKKVITEIVTESDLIPAALSWYSQTEAQGRYASGEAEAWVGEPDVVQLFLFMTVENWRTIRWEVLTNEILTEFVETSVDGTYEWIDSDDPVPDITWDLTPFKDRVDSQHGITSIAVAYSALPDCNQDQINDFKTRLAAAPPGTQVLYNLCEFPDPWYEDQFSDYLESLGDLVANVPNAFDLTETLAGLEDTAGVGPAVIKTQLRLIRMVMNLAPLIPILLLFLILIFAVRGLKSLGLWWGIPLTVGAIWALAMALVYRPLITQLLASGPLSETPEVIQSEAILAILILAAEIFKPLLWQSLVVLIVSLILLLVGGLTKSRRKQEEAEMLERME